jgi:hypothetical protein
MERFSAIACWIAVGVLVALILIRGIGTFVALVLLFVHSPLPWWILTPAAMALVAGFIYLFKHLKS